MAKYECRIDNFYLEKCGIQRTCDSFGSSEAITFGSDGNVILLYGLKCTWKKWGYEKSTVIKITQSMLTLKIFVIFFTFAKVV